MIGRGNYEEQVELLTRFYQQVEPGVKSAAEVRAIVDRRRNAVSPPLLPIPSLPQTNLLLLSPPCRGHRKGRPSRQGHLRSSVENCVSNTVSTHSR